MLDDRNRQGMTGVRTEDTSSSNKINTHHTGEFEFRVSHNTRKILCFYFLCFAFLGLIPVADGLAGGGLMDFDRLGRSASEATGIAWTSNLVGMVRLANAEPGLWLLLLGSAAPLLAALLTILIWPARVSALRQWARQLSPMGAATSLQATALAYVGVAALCLLALLGSAALSRLSGAPALATPAVAINLALLPVLLMSGLLDQGALLEEGGWRGFAGPQLESRYSPAVAALVVGIAWGLWHLPRDVTTGVLERLGAVGYLLAYLPSFLLGTIAVSMIASWGMMRSGGSLWPAILAHGIANDAFGLAGDVSIIEALTPEHQLTRGVPLMLSAGVILAFDRKRMFSRLKPR